MSEKQKLIQKALAYNFKGNYYFDESYCSNTLMCNLNNNFKAIDFKGTEKPSNTQLRYFSNKPLKRFEWAYSTSLSARVPGINFPTWGIEFGVAWNDSPRYVDLAYVDGNNTKPKNASILAEVKIWKPFKDKKAFNVCGHEYPFVYLGGSLNNNFLNTFSICSENINKRKTELENVENNKLLNNPKTAGKMGAIQGNLCCFQPTADGSCLIATDADEGQLFKDFVKMLNYSHDPVWESEIPNYSYDMLQVLYIATEKDKWGHVHDKVYIINKLNDLFKQFFDIAKNAGSFQVYCYKSLQPKVSYVPVVFPTAKVHFGNKFIVEAKGYPGHDVTSLVIEWKWPVTDTNNNEPDIPDKIFEC